MKIYTIYDSKLEAHTMLMSNENENTMKRELSTRLKNTPMEQHAADYTLLEIAAFDEVTGTITPYTAHRSVINLIQLFGSVPGNGNTVGDD